MYLIFDIVTTSYWGREHLAAKQRDQDVHEKSLIIKWAMCAMSLFGPN